MFTAISNFFAMIANLFAAGANTTAGLERASVRSMSIADKFVKNGIMEDATESIKLHQKLAQTIKEITVDDSVDDDIKAMIIADLKKSLGMPESGDK